MSRAATPAGGKMKVNKSVTYPAVSNMASDGGVSLSDSLQQLSFTNGNASAWPASPAPTQEGNYKGLTHGSTYSQTAGMVPTAVPFTPGGGSSSAGSRLAPVTSKPTPVSILARDSQPDGPTIVESNPKKDSYIEGFDQKAIGNGSSREHTPPNGNVVLFTTDSITDGTHFVKVVKVEQSGYPKCMDILQNDFHWQQKLLGQRSDHDDPSKKYITLYFCFDNLEDARGSFHDMSVASNEHWEPCFVFHDEYAAAPLGDQTDIGRYDGQVCFEATFDDVLSNVVVPDIKEVVHNLARDFGRVVAMADVSMRGTNTVTFRVEYAKVTDARMALREVSNSPLIHQEWTIRAKPVHRSSATSTNCAVVPYTPHKQVGTALTPGIHFSPTGRTTWEVKPDGTIIPRSPPNPVAKVVTAPSDQVTPVSRDRWFSEPMPFTQYHVDAATYQQRAQSWSTNTATGPRYANTETEPQCVRIDRIRNGMDVRTTVMLRNLPNKWGVTEWKRMLDKYTFGMYDFSYLRIDFGNSYNVGYGFVNFTDSKHIGRFLDHWLGEEWEPGHHPEKRVQLSYATVQGYDCLVEKFRNSSIMEEFEGYRPKLWYTHETAPSNDLIGTEKKFDPPNNRTKQQRSRDNAGHIGLYAPRSGQRGQDRARRSNFDRGTPRQLQEDAQWQAQHGLFNPAFNFQQGQYIAGGPGPVGAPPAAMFPAGMYASSAAINPYINNQVPMNGMYPFAPQQYGAPPFMPAPGAYGPGYGNGYAFAGYGPRNPANMSRTISRGRLAGGRPQNVTLSRDYEVPRMLGGGDQYAPATPTANGGHGYQYADQY